MALLIAFNSCILVYVCRILMFMEEKKNKTKHRII